MTGVTGLWPLLEVLLALGCVVLSAFLIVPVVETGRLNA
jgi:hypothetical protein